MPMFGIQIPEGLSYEFTFKQASVTTLWEDSIKKEMAEFVEYNIFKPLPRGKSSPPGYKRIQYCFVFDIKFDLRMKSRLVAGRYRTDPIVELYSVEW